MIVILVLGHRNDAILQKRMDAAIEYFNSVYEKKYYEWLDETVPTATLLLSGGSSDGKSVPTGAEKMKKYAILKGIDPDAIITETTSRDTVENFRNSLDILKTTLREVVSDVVVCTSSFHIRRAFVIAHTILGGYNLKFIHTHEEISNELKLREMKLTYDFISKLLT